MAFDAKYPGTCRDCRGEIAPGERIERAGPGRRGGYRHVDCEAADTRTWKQKYGRCEDAPCCGCCGGWQEAETGYVIYG